MPRSYQGYDLLLKSGELTLHTKSIRTSISSSVYAVILDFSYCVSEFLISIISITPYQGLYLLKRERNKSLPGTKRGDIEVKTIISQLNCDAVH